MSDTVNTNNTSVVPEYKPTVAIIQIVVSFLLQHNRSPCRCSGNPLL